MPFCNRSKIVYFNSFDVEHLPEDIKEIFVNKNMIVNIFRGKANKSVMCGYFCTGFIDFMLVRKKLTEFTSLFSPYDKIYLSGHIKIRLSEIIRIEKIFHQEINQGKSCS